MTRLKDMPIFQVSFYDKELTNIGCIWVSCHSEAVKIKARYEIRNTGLVAEVEEYAIDLTKKFMIDFLNKVASHGLVSCACGIAQKKAA